MASTPTSDEAGRDPPRRDGSSECRTPPPARREEQAEVGLEASGRASLSGGPQTDDGLQVEGVREQIEDLHRVGAQPRAANRARSRPRVGGSQDT